jgi:hypothetical protein
MKENPFYILCSGLLLVVLAHMFPFQTRSASDPHVSPSQTQPEKAPAPTRSLEKIDQWNLHTFGGSGVYLFRVTTCYYVFAFGDNSVAVTHLESCPSPEHRKPLPTGVNNQVHPGDPIIGRPLGGIPEFSGVILEDEAKKKKP